MNYIACIEYYYYGPDRREGSNKHCFCPSVRLSVRRVRSE